MHSANTTKHLFLAALVFFFASSILLVSGETFLTVCEADDVEFPYLVQLDSTAGTTSILGSLDPGTTALIYPWDYEGWRPAFGMHLHCDGKLYFSFSDATSDNYWSYYNWGTLVRRFDVPYPNGQGWNFNAGHTDQFFQHGTWSGLTGDCSGNLVSLGEEAGGFYAMNFQPPASSEYSRDLYSATSYGSLAYNYLTGGFVGMNVNNDDSWYPTNTSTPAAFVYYLNPKALTTSVEAAAIAESTSFFRDYDNFELSNDGTLGYMLVNTAVGPTDGQGRRSGVGRRTVADTPAVNSLFVWDLSNITVIENIPLDGPFQACYGLTKAQNPCSSCNGYIQHPFHQGKREPLAPEPGVEAIPLARSQ